MGIIEWTKNQIVQRLDKDIRIFNASENQAKDADLPFLNTWFFRTTLGQPRFVNYVELRQYAKSPFVQMATKSIIKQMKDTQWEIVLEDEEERPSKKDKEEMKRLKTFLEYPNRNSDTFDDLWGMWLQDVLEIDAGLIFKGRNPKGKLAELFAYDGARFVFDIDKHGIVKGYYQYSFQNMNGQPIPFRKDDIVYGRMNANTEFYPYGWSPLQSIQQEVEVMIQSTRYNKEFFINNSIPDGIVSADMASDQLQRLQSQWEQKIKGQAHKLLFLNSKSATFTPMKLSNKDMEWLEGQKWYFHIVLGAYGLSPAEVGFYEDVNRSSQEGQERTTRRNAIKPFLSLIEVMINTQILPELVGTEIDSAGNKRVRYKFKWFPKDEHSEEAEHKQLMDKLNAGVYTINEIRKMEGKDEVEWGDQPLSLSRQASFPEAENEVPKDENEQKIMLFSTKKKEVAGHNTLDVGLIAKILSEKIDQKEAEDYATFLRKEMTKWEKEILRAFDEHLEKETETKNLEKSFSQFIAAVFNKVNTTGFMAKLKFILKRNFSEGVNEAEKELELDIGFHPSFDQQIQTLTNQQLEGFRINNAHWHGIKGVAKELQTQIVEEVRDGLSQKKTPTEIKNTIKTIMAREKGGEVDGEVTEGRAMRIARTETNRIRNLGRLQAYKESGIKGQKQWVALRDHKTTPLCKRLHGQTANINNPFMDEETGEEFMHPPGHPNCRSVMRFVFEK